MRTTTSERRRLRLGRAVAAASGVALMALWGVAPAAAEPILENAHYKGSETHIEQEEHEGWCPDVDFLVEFTGRFTAHFKAMTRGADGLWYFSGGFSANNTYTNLENGKTLTERVRVQFGDRHITDNGDGTITIRASDVGSNLLFGPDGRQLAHDAGRTSITVLVDTNGTTDPEDDEVLWEDTQRVGHFTFGDLDHCTVIEEQLG